MPFWGILGQRKTSLVVFLWKKRTSLVVFLATILFLMTYIRLLEIILTKKNTELVLFFHKNTTKLVFIWSNITQKSIKVLTNNIRGWFWFFLNRNFILANSLNLRSTDNFKFFPITIPCDKILLDTCKVQRFTYVEDNIQFSFSET